MVLVDLAAGSTRDVITEGAGPRTSGPAWASFPTAATRRCCSTTATTGSHSRALRDFDRRAQDPRGGSWSGRRQRVLGRVGCLWTARSARGGERRSKLPDELGAGDALDQRVTTPCRWTGARARGQRELDRARSSRSPRTTACTSWAPADTLWAVATDGTFVVAGRDEYRVMIRSGTGAERRLGRGRPPTRGGAHDGRQRRYVRGRSPRVPRAAVAARRTVLRPRWRGRGGPFRLHDGMAGRIWRAGARARAQPRQIPPRPEGGPAPTPHLARAEHLRSLRPRRRHLRRPSSHCRTPRDCSRLAAMRGALARPRRAQSGEQVIGVYDLKSVAPSGG